MKWVTAIVKPFQVDEVVEALLAAGVEEVLVEEVRGYGRQKGHLELYQGAEYDITFLPKVKLEWAVEDHRLKEAVRAVVEAARTGRIGDGKVLVRDVRTSRGVGEGEGP